MSTKSKYLSKSALLGMMVLIMLLVSLVGCKPHQLKRRPGRDNPPRSNRR